MSVDAGGVIEAAAIVQVEHQVDFRFGDDLLDPVDLTKLGVCSGNMLELEIHISTNPLNNTRKVQVGNDPQGAPLNPVAGDQHGRGMKTARFITVNTTDHQQGRAGSCAGFFVQRKIEGQQLHREK